MDDRQTLILGRALASPVVGYAAFAAGGFALLSILVLYFGVPEFAFAPIAWFAVGSSISAVVLGLIGRRRSLRRSVERKLATAGLAIGAGLIVSAITLGALLYVALGGICDQYGCM